MAVGAGMACLAFLTTQFWQSARSDPRYLYISVALEKADQDRAIAAAGRCAGRFRVIFPFDAYFIVIPLKSLDREGFICLTEELAPVRHTLDIRAAETL